MAGKKGKDDKRKTNGANLGFEEKLWQARTRCVAIWTQQNTSM